MRATVMIGAVLGLMVGLAAGPGAQENADGNGVIAETIADGTVRVAEATVPASDLRGNPAADGCRKDILYFIDEMLRQETPSNAEDRGSRRVRQSAVEDTLPPTGVGFPAPLDAAPSQLSGESMADAVHEVVLDCPPHCPQHNPLAAELDTGELRRRGDGVSVLPVYVKVPIRNLSLLPGAAAHEVRLSLFVMTRNESGGLSAVQELPFHLRIPSSEVAHAVSSFAVYNHPLPVHAGDQRVFVGVRDDLTGTVATLSLEL